MKLSYLQNVYITRPLKLRYVKEGALQETVSFQLRQMNDNYTKLCNILDFKMKPSVYIRGNVVSLRTTDDRKRFSGVHISRVVGSVIYITCSEKMANMIFSLAHEMFHEYQYRHSLEFKEESIEEREIQAHGFALAYCELIGYECGRQNPKEYYPDCKTHVEFSEETRGEVDEDGFPVVVRIWAGKYREKFNLNPRPLYD